MITTRMLTSLTDKTRLIPGALCLLGALLATAAQAELPVVEGAHTPAPPPGANVAAAYLSVHNQGEQTLSITGASSSVASHTELHLTRIVDEVASMEEQASIDIAPGDSLEFGHGGYHVMLLGLQQPLAAGDSYTLELLTSDGLITVTVPVTEAGPAPSDKSGSTH